MEWLTILLLICAVAFLGFESYTLVRAIVRRRKGKADADRIESEEKKGE